MSEQEQDLTWDELPPRVWRRLGWCSDSRAEGLAMGAPPRGFVAHYPHGSTSLELILWGAAPGYAALVTADILEALYEPPDSADLVQWAAGLEVLRSDIAHPGSAVYVSEQAYSAACEWAAGGERAHVRLAQRALWNAVNARIRHTIEARAGAFRPAPNELLVRTSIGHFYFNGEGMRRLRAACTGDNWWQLVRGVRWQLAQLRQLGQLK